MTNNRSRPHGPAYTQIKGEEDGEVNTRQHSRSSLSERYRLLLVLLLLVLPVALTICGYAHWMLEPSKSSSATPIACKKPSTRREWRTLTIPQRHKYLAAVQCLNTRPSRLGLNHTLYDDFPWIHSRVGAYVHDAAPFLAWHRYFIHIYESALREECEFTGSMPFWDWRLDWQDVTKAPVWDGEHGFGTTGHPQRSEHSIVNGYCVVDGPFKDITILYLDEKHYPHCLSRGFVEGKELKVQSMMLKPDAIEDLLGLDDYDSFNIGLEHGPHLAIPRSIRGDFSLLTAPSDPVFFLHHMQLDHLWWIWQGMQPDRKSDYGGVASQGSNERASSNDRLLMGGLAPDVTVSQVLDTQRNIFCYQY